MEIDIHFVLFYNNTLKIDVYFSKSKHPMILDLKIKGLGKTAVYLK
jgi:hypothetical protein